MRTFLQTSGKIIGSTALCFIVACLPGMATPINGIFDGSGVATVSFTNFNLCPNGQAPSGANSASACTAATGNITLSGGTGSFSSITASFGDLSTILSLSSTAEPVGTPVSVANWLVFDPTVGTPPIMITLTEVTPGSFGTTDCSLGAAAGQTCTPTGSAFNLQNQTATTSSATTTFDIKATDSAGDVALGTATFSNSFSVPYQTLLAALSTGGDTGNYSSTYSATFTLSAVPEPATVTLSLSGLALLGVGFLRRRRRVVRK
jgi:hypothetical protein